MVQNLVQDLSEDFWLDDDFRDDIIVKSKGKSHPRKTKKEIEKINFVYDDNKSKTIGRLLEIPIPKSAKTLLTKLIANGQLISVNKVLFRKKKSIILSGKCDRTNRNFRFLSSDDVIIKILINGNKAELWKRANDECNQDKHLEYGTNRPMFLLQTGNIIITSMIGTGGKPAATLKQVLRSNEINVAMVYNDVVRFWCMTRNVTFDPSNILYHDGKWWIVGYGLPHAWSNESVDTSTQLLLFYRTNLKRLIEFFCRNGLFIKQAEDPPYGFMKHSVGYSWYTLRTIRFKTQKTQ